jgi:hypothetical protein
LGFPTRAIFKLSPEVDRLIPLCSIRGNSQAVIGSAGKKVN